MDAFERELLRRSPLAACVLEVCDFVFDPPFLASVWDANRGRCYEDVLKFEDFLRLTRDALVRHGGSAHARFLELERRDAEPVDESNYYRKLARTPVGVSRALLREGSRRLKELLPGGEGAMPAEALAACFDGFEVIVGDGKKIKDAAKRLKPTRGYSGKLIGAKALVAMDARTGMAVAMSDSLDGLANDVPLVPALMGQLRGTIARPVLSVWDRQFDDVRTLGHLSARPGDAFVVRVKQKNHTFVVDSAAETADPQGRTVRDEVGLLGKGKNASREWLGKRLPCDLPGRPCRGVERVQNRLGDQLLPGLLGFLRRGWRRGPALQVAPLVDAAAVVVHRLVGQARPDRPDLGGAVDAVGADAVNDRAVPSVRQTALHHQIPQRPPVRRGGVDRDLRQVLRHQRLERRREPLAMIDPV